MSTVVVPRDVAEDVLRLLSVAIVRLPRETGGQLSPRAREIFDAFYGAVRRDEIPKGARPAEVAHSALSVAEAAEVRGCSPEYMRRLCRTGRVPARRSAAGWLVMVPDTELAEAG